VSDFENKPIRDAILGVHHVHKFCLTKLTLSTALTVQQIYEKCGALVTGKQQVLDSVKTLAQKGLVKKLRESRGVVYYRDVPMSEEEFLEWANRPKGKRGGYHPRKTKPVKDPLLELTKINRSMPATSIPEITVTDTAIVILHARCKITVEFNS
jgi:predicted transcriptional regulator